MALKADWAVPVVRSPDYSPVVPTMAPVRRRRNGIGAGLHGNYLEHAVRRGRDALLAAADELQPTDPMLPAVLRFAARHGRRRLAAPLLGSWKARAIGQRGLERHLPWRLGFDSLPNSEVYDTPDRVGALWRPRERDWLERDATAFGHRLLGPVVLAETLELLCELEVDANPELARAAGELLRDLQPIVEGEIADFIRGDDPWRDTFGLWQVVAHPRALALLHPIVKVVAIHYATLASRLAGLVCGTRFPFEAVPLVSANAHLGLGLWALDHRPTLLPGIVDFLRAEQRPDGGWSDEGQPSDVLTTLAAAELLGSLDPGFDPAPTVDFFLRAQEPAGWWRALDPETPWLTAAVLDWIGRAEQPFGERFRWPERPRTELDRKTSVPTVAAYDQLVRVFGDLPSLADASIGVAFVDLAGFRAFNNAFGQIAGDRALRFFAQELSGLPSAQVIRDGGDEFLVVGAPTSRGLADDLDAWRARWPERFRERFGSDVPPVAPRFVVARARGRDLAATRERLGLAIGALKGTPLAPDGSGVLRTLHD